MNVEAFAAKVNELVGQAVVQMTVTGNTPLLWVGAPAKAGNAAHITRQAWQIPPRKAAFTSSLEKSHAQ